MEFHGMLDSHDGLLDINSITRTGSVTNMIPGGDTWHVRDLARFLGSLSALQQRVEQGRIIIDGTSIAMDPDTGKLSWEVDASWRVPLSGGLLYLTSQVHEAHLSIDPSSLHAVVEAAIIGEHLRQHRQRGVGLSKSGFRREPGP